MLRQILGPAERQHSDARPCLVDRQERAFVNNNPVQERDLFYMGMLKPLGGKPFNPDARQRAILDEAARIGDAMGRVTLMEGPERFGNPEPFPGTK